MKYLFATDLDGTLLAPDGTIGPRTRTALEVARDAGVRIVFVTGRPPRWMGAVGEQTGHVGVCICANGAVVLDLASEQVTGVATIAEQDGTGIIRDVRAHFGARVRFAVERVRLGPMDSGAGPTAESHSREFTQEAGYRPRLAPPEGAGVDTAEHLMRGGDVVKILARFNEPGSDDDAYLRQAATIAAGRSTVTRSNSPTLLEFGPAGVTKASALADLALTWGIAQSHVVAAGDMPNDLHMLRWAGRGVAVQGAHQHVIAAADEVVAGPESDGLEPVLVQLAHRAVTESLSH